jgi:hypothetical protein
MDAAQRHVTVGIGVFFGPIAFAIALELKYALLHYLCHNHAAWALWLINLAALLITLWSAAACRRFENRFLAMGGLAINAMFAVSIIALSIPDFFLGPCD